MYANVIELSLNISKQNEGKISMIVQLPIVCTDRMIPLQALLLNSDMNSWFSNYDDRPAKLFDGLEHIRATIFIAEKNLRTTNNIFTTKYNRWYKEGRLYLFDILQHTSLNKQKTKGAIPKIGDDISKSILSKIQTFSPLAKIQRNNTKYINYFHNSPQYWIRSTNFVPFFWNDRDGEKVSVQVKSLHFDTTQYAVYANAILNSTLFYWWFIILSDCRHLNMREINNFPINIDHIKSFHENAFLNP